MLAFAHEKCDVITSSWTASFRNGRMTVCYLWGADGYSTIAGATGVRRVEFRMTRDAFCNGLERAARGGYPLMLQGDN